MSSSSAHLQEANISYKEVGLVSEKENPLYLFTVITDYLFRLVWVLLSVLKLLFLLSKQVHVLSDEVILKDSAVDLCGIIILCMSILFCAHTAPTSKNVN